MRRMEIESESSGTKEEEKGPSRSGLTETGRYPINIGLESSESSARALFVDRLGIDGPHAAAMGGNHDDVVPWMDD